MIKYLVLESTRKLNLFPVKGGVSPYYSPHTIMSQQPLDYNKHLQIPFGTYVQALHESNPSNTNLERMLDAIYLRPLQNSQGGHELMDLHTGSVITRRRVTVVPLPNTI